MRQFINLKLTEEKTNSLTPAALGQSTFNEVKANNGYVQHRKDTEGNSILTIDDQEALTNLKTEKELVLVMTVHFHRIFSQAGYPLVYVNSEEIRWLLQAEHLSNDTAMKPDGFVTFTGSFDSRDMPVDKMAEVRRNYKQVPFAFGTPIKKLYNSIVIFECKQSFNEGSDFGQVNV